jgi:hypothetical protein
MTSFVIALLAALAIQGPASMACTTCAIEPADEWIRICEHAIQLECNGRKELRCQPLGQLISWVKFDRPAPDHFHPPRLLKCQPDDRWPDPCCYVWRGFYPRRWGG